MGNTLQFQNSARYKEEDALSQGLYSYLLVYARMLLKPVEFFEKTEFYAEASASIRTIGIFALASGVVSMWSWKSPQPLMIVAFPVMAIFFASAVSSILATMRGLIGVSAGYRQFLRFFAYYQMMAFPLAVISLGNYRLACLVNLFAVLWGILGFIIAFKPKSRPFYTFAAIVAGVCSLTTVGTFAAYESSTYAGGAVNAAIKSAASNLASTSGKPAGKVTCNETP